MSEDTEDSRIHRCLWQLPPWPPPHVIVSSAHSALSDSTWFSGGNLWLLAHGDTVFIYKTASPPSPWSKVQFHNYLIYLSGSRKPAVPCYSEALILINSSVSDGVFNPGWSFSFLQICSWQQQRWGLSTSSRCTVRMADFWTSALNFRPTLRSLSTDWMWWRLTYTVSVFCSLC